MALLTFTSSSTGFLVGDAMVPFCAARRAGVRVWGAASGHYSQCAVVGAVLGAALGQLRGKRLDLFDLLVLCLFLGLVVGSMLTLLGGCVFEALESQLHKATSRSRIHAETRRGVVSDLRLRHRPSPLALCEGAALTERQTAK